MSTRFVSASAAVLYACVMMHSSSAEELRCDSLAPLRGSKSGYQSRGNRCEGLYVSKVGSRSLAAMSFTLGRVRYDLATAKAIEVTAPGQTQPVNVRALAIPLKTYYRMDATLAPGATLRWLLKDVLAPEGLTDNRIGVFGWRGAEDSRTLVPVRVTSAGAASASQAPLLIIQASFDAQRVKWRWGASRNEQCSALGAWQDAIQRPVAAGWPIAIDLSALPAGTHCLEAVAQSDASTGWSPLKLRIDIPSR
ncbi:MAG TPA: hypothetical protein VNA69_16075 [Thermoanaerobaculia bacterium]|nr:hypothetical protein [Thermoanaerobaculia bacterium]